MIAVEDIKITKANNSKLQNLSLDNVPFGKYFTDHMLVAEYDNGIWGDVAIKPYQPLSFDPSLAALHYGQAIFEGIKAYKAADGSVNIFRPMDNFKRFNSSARRMEMPEVPENVFMDGMKQLISLDIDWVPNKKDHALYIRPFMFSTEETIGVKASQKYLFLIILSPTGPYYAAPMKINVEEKYVRAAPGGIGFAKAAGNYGAAMLASAEAKKQGFDQVLWMDALEHKYVQECGTMNVFFVFGNTVVTPDLTTGTILEGVTRDSVITILKQIGYTVEERPISIQEIVTAFKAGLLQEAFGTGTAVTVALIKELKYKDEDMIFEEKNWKAAPQVKQQMDAIKDGTAPDTNNWLIKINK